MNNVISAILIIAIIILLILACAFVWMTTPGKFRWFELPSVYCHRGLYDNKTVPENSLASFRLAAEKNLAVELDVRQTKDGSLVVFHDENLARLCGDSRKVCEVELSELKELALINTDEHIPTFEEALDTCGGVPVYCEIKTDSIDIDEAFLSKVFELMSSYKGEIVAVSFNPYVLRWFKDNHPEIIRGFLSCDFKEKRSSGGDAFTYTILANMMTNFMAKPDFISYRYTDKSLGLAMCRFYGARLVAWTVHSMDDVETAANLGYSTFVGEHFDMTEV